MDQELRRRFRKLESANKKVSIENRRLAREVMDLQTRLAKLEGSVPEARRLAKASDKMVARLHGAVAKVVTAIGKVDAKIAKLRPGTAPRRSATRSAAHRGKARR